GSMAPCCPSTRSCFAISASRWAIGFSSSISDRACMRRRYRSRCSRRRGVDHGAPCSRRNRRNTAGGVRRHSKRSPTDGGSQANAPRFSNQIMPRRLLDKVTRRLELPADRDARMQQLLDTEWIVTIGLGGYSSCSMAGVITRRYHGLLVAALPNPLGRMVMLNHLGECVSANGTSVPLNGEERVAGRIDSALAERVVSVRLEAGLPVWEYEWEGVRIEKRILMPHRQNTVHVTYRLLDG